MVIQPNTVEETQAFGERLGRQLRGGDVLALMGPLGAGKTTLVTGLARGLGVSAGYVVNSPTFVFAQIYQGKLPLYHIDLYRVEKATELQSLGLEEMIGTDGVAVIEWFDRFQQIWPKDRIELRLAFAEDGGRHIEVKGVGVRGKTVMAALEKST